METEFETEVEDVISLDPGGGVICTYWKSKVTIFKRRDGSRIAHVQIIEPKEELPSELEYE